MITNRFKRDNDHTSAARGQVTSLVKQEQQELKWSIAEMEKIIHRERTVRQQAQLAAEQALTAAKEAQKVILQLEQELDSKDQQLHQERTVRMQVELAAQKADRAVIEATQHQSSPVTKEERESKLAHTRQFRCCCR